MATINALQNYIRLMAPAFSDVENMPVETLFQTLFTSGHKIIDLDASSVDIDIQRGGTTKSAYIARGSDANTIAVNRALLEKYTSVNRVYPLIEEITPITSTMIGKRMPGESASKPLPTQKKQSLLAMKAHGVHIKKIIREMEFSAAESMRTGAQTVAEGAYDFYRRSTHNAAVGTVWSTAATATPVTDLTNAGQLIARDSHRRPTDIIFGQGSWTEFLATTQIQNLADKRRLIHFVTDMAVDTIAGYEDWTAAGATFMGQIQTGIYKYNMWVYPAVYDASGTDTLYLPDGEIIVLAKGSRYDRYFGPKDRLEMDQSFVKKMFGIGDVSGTPAGVQNAGIFSSDMFHFDVFAKGNNKALNIRTQAAPIFVPVDADSVVKMTT